jgi:hypothetical protein
VQGSIAQSLGIVMSGNAFLQGWVLDRFWPDSTIFAFCRSVSFVRRERGWLGRREVEVAADPLAWLKGLKPRCHGLRLRVLGRNQSDISDIMSVGFAGGGPKWLIDTVRDEHPTVWSDEWMLTHDRAADHRIWSVVYRGDPLERNALVDVDLDGAEHKLTAALEAIDDFARRTESGFRPAFRKALEFLGGEDPAPPSYHDDLAPAGFLSPQAARLLAASQAGWVFGGMGSWNDSYFGGGDATEYDRVSEALFGALQAALVAAANSTCKG